MCTGTGLGSLLRASGSNRWVYYWRNYMATQSVPMLQFSAHGDSSDTVYLDDVSVVDVNLPTVQLLTNPSFETSTSRPIGWLMWCASSCMCSGGEGRISTSSYKINSGEN
ncbi:unnamed protein product [Rotaria magnacalcarata]|uniref:Uncharacterized protein n=1 Tax=Rotaria magnacalcarata TaxID=392030 RepID=A0A816YYU8_9BILA|nr:unnamed protein product [Rotaria magnacalcarata]CAF2169568.1 unnamed protein product [Rotaria magnacalcarata]CAF3855041.1 unnamed protein product [Rotaria magnacalcarata]CAF4291576.1 unnamed protein product [Rotaria magnacalcarata]